QLARIVTAKNWVSRPSRAKLTVAREPFVAAAQCAQAAQLRQPEINVIRELLKQKRGGGEQPAGIGVVMSERAPGDQLEAMPGRGGLKRLVRELGTVAIVRLERELQLIVIVVEARVGQVETKRAVPKRSRHERHSPRANRAKSREERLGEHLF